MAAPSTHAQESIASPLLSSQTLANPHRRRCDERRCSVLRAETVVGKGYRPPARLHNGRATSKAGAPLQGRGWRRKPLPTSEMTKRINLTSRGYDTLKAPPV